MNRDVEEMHICVRGLRVANRLSPVYQSFVDVGLGKTKTGERRDVIMTEVLFLMQHSPSVAHQATIDSLERHYSQTKRQKNRCYDYL